MTSPDPTHTILIEDFLFADDKQLFDLSLRNQHAVKRILVGSGQHPRTNSMVVRHWQTQELFPVKIASEVLDQLGSARQPTQSKFRCNLPSGNRADKNAAVRLGNQFSARLG